MGSNARTAQLSRGFGIAAVLALGAGPLLAQLGATTPYVGFRIFLGGLLLGLMAVIVGAIGLVQTRASTGRGGRGSAIAGIVLGLIPVAVVAAAVSGTGGGPMINDITTNPADAPAFQTAQTLSANAGRDLAYPGASFADAQRAGYADLMPIRVPGTPEEVYVRCVAAAEALGWTLTAHDPAGGTFERRPMGLRVAMVDGIFYGLTALDGFDGEPTRLWLGAMAGGQHRRVGPEWEQVSEADDESRARALIAEHQQSMSAAVAA
jgi:hypothetical protein